MLKQLLFQFVFLMCSLVAASTAKGQPISPAYDSMLRQLLTMDIDLVSPAELKAMKSSLLLLDARESKEYKVSHLAGARWVGYKNFSVTKVNDIPATTPIVVYCSVGYRSEAIARKLRQKGFTNVRNLYGGIFQWVNENNQVVNSAGPTDSVHAYDQQWGVWLLKGDKVY